LWGINRNASEKDGGKCFWGCDGDIKKFQGARH
jgi:hypothetical protein